MSDRDPAVPLTFHWPRRANPSIWLLAFILLSLLLHSAAFFVFQGRTRISTRSPRTSPPVQLLTAFGPDGTRSPDNESFLQWIATHDPSFVASMPGVEPKGLLDIPYRESFQKVRTHPLGVPPEPATIAFPPPHDPLALIQRAIPRTSPRAVIAARQSTRVSFSKNLSPRVPADLKYIPVAKAKGPLESTALMIGITDKGAVRFKFLQQSGGSPDLDREASGFIDAIQFSPSEAPIEWGTVTFSWGDEADDPTRATPEPPR